MSGYDPQTFADALLQSIGAPVTPGNVGFVEAWEAKEGGNWNNTARFNPLNTSLYAPGATAYKPGAAVKSYISWAQGLGATVSTLLEGRYDAVVSALRGDDPATARQALIDSPWDEAHYASGFPTSAAGAAYAKAHRGGGGGGGGGILGTIADGVGGAVHDLNPVNAAKDAAGAVTDAVGAVWGDFKDFAVKMAFTGLGLSLITIGLYQAAKPAIDATAKAAADGAKLAAA